MIQILLALSSLCLISRVEFNIPGSEVPVTMQTLLVLLIPMLVGGKWGVLTIALYLIMGFAGLPVFSGGSAGIEKLWGPTGGFLIGFLVAAIFTGYLKDQQLLISSWQVATAFAIGHVIILAIGCTRLAQLNGNQGLFNNVFMPLIPGLFIKIIAGTILFLLFEKLVK